MGKRSRQKAAPRQRNADPQSRRARLRERADVASRAAEKQIKQRPAAPWDPFPLTELAVFSGIVLLVVGLFVPGDTGRGLVVAGVVLASIGGLETAIREHFGGFRSHAGLLSGIGALATLIATTSLLGISPAIGAGTAIAVFGLLFPTLRSSFIRRSGGRGVI
ncbi:MAG: hypothetical protein HYX29_10020 [Solirubrobacterales bacterium]|nr:hypothetical protein [Solirubrobacterales bacterium]